MSIYTPYTYLIGWSKHQKYYYGVRYGKGCHPDDFWVSYFTSSKRVDHFRKEYGEPDIIQIRKTFQTKEKARIWEHTAIRRCGMVDDDRFFNCHDGGKTFMNKGGYTLPPRSIEHSKKISDANTGKLWCNDDKMKRSEQYSGNGNPRYGVVMSRQERIVLLKKQGTYRPFFINGKYYELKSDAAEELNIKIGTISYRLHNKKYKWKEWRYTDDVENYKYKEHGNKGRKRPDLVERNRKNKVL